MASLMGFVLLIAIGLGALKSATNLLADLMTTLVTATLLFSILALIHTTGDMRRFWTGFVVFGWGFLVFDGRHFQKYVGRYLPTDSLLTSLHSRIARLEAPRQTSETISVWIRRGSAVWVDGQDAADEKELTELLEKAVSKKGVQGVSVFTNPDTNHNTIQKEWAAVEQAGVKAGISVSHSLTTMKPEWDCFRRIGHSLIVLLAAFVGGSVAWLFLRQKKGREG